ncbi:MAG: MaoC family dehydratase N-terminal domain-containing protein [Proteobacteria bacterium]|nr:MaoC family dehydratase N-terminal domain-containing protein [Pseudomonadota bacterium]
MPFDANEVGRAFGAAETMVDTRRILAFAAAVGETDPAVFDDARPGGIVAPASFCVVPEWQIVRAAREAGLGGLTLEERRRVVHAGQDSVFHRPIRPGDRLRSEAVLVEARSIPAGTLALLRLSTTEAGSGDPVATSYASFVYRGVALKGEARRVGDVSAPPEGSQAPLPADAAAVDIAIPRTLPHLYTEATGIWNPIHTERKAALAAGLPDTILHGTTSWALAAREIRRAHGFGPAAIRRLSGRFAAMVVPGSALRLHHAETAPGIIRFELLNDAGERAIDRGCLAVSQP